MSSTYDKILDNNDMFTSVVPYGQHNRCQNEGSADWGYVVLN